MLLVPPKCEIVMMLTNCQFQYSDTNIGLFSFASFIVIANFLLCFILCSIVIIFIDLLITIAIVGALFRSQRRKRKVSLLLSQKDSFLRINIENRAMNQRTKPNKKLSKEVQKNIFIYCKVGRAITLWGKYSASLFLEYQYNFSPQIYAFLLIRFLSLKLELPEDQKKLLANLIK